MRDALLRWSLPLLLLAALPARADDAAIASVRTLAGSATVVREGAVQPLALGQALHEGDVVETGRDGQLGITFRDNTRIALGPASRVDVTRFVFKPQEKELGLGLRLLQGSLQYISGLTAKLAPEAVSIQTPTATIAVRGTRFLVRTEGAQ